MKNKIDKPFLKQIGLLFFIGIIINAFCFLLYFFPSHADSPSYFPMGQNDNNKFNQTTLNYIDSRFDSANNFVFVTYLGKSQSGASDLYCALTWAKNSDESNRVYGEIKNNGYQFSLYPNPGAQRQAFYYYNGACTDYYDSQLNWNLLTQNIDSSIYNTNKSYVTNFRIYRTNDVNSGVVLKYGIEEPENPGIILGEAIPPHEIETPVYSQGHAKPESVPNNITYNSYSWTTYNPPSVDSSGIIEVIESEIYVINYLMGWLKDNIHGEFSTILANLQTSFNNVTANIQYFGGLILNAIISGIQNFYDNMVSLFQNFFDNFSEPLDKEAVYEAYEDTSIYSLVSLGSNFKTTYSNFFDSVIPVNTLTFSIPYTILSKSGYVVVDFSWYDDIRDSIVPWIIGFLYAGFGLSLFRSLPSIIHGLSGVMQKGA